MAWIENVVASVMMNTSLDGCRAKIERARGHLRELETEIRSFLATAPYSIGTKRDPQTRRLVYFLTNVREIPPMFAIVTGEVLHQLRSALDQLAYQLVLVGTGGKGPFKGVYFPITDSAAKYQSDRGAKVKGMQEKAIQAIDALRPYKGGNDILWRLHELNKIDKHRLLLTVGSAYRSIDIGPILQRGMPNDFQAPSNMPPLSLHLRPADRLFPLIAGAELFVDLPDAEPDPKIQFTFNIELREAGIDEGNSLVETLEHMVTAVDDVVSKIAPLVN